ncbi:MAG: phage scaffolding protein [Oscillospiraceae bacterium]|nr:phage scaffolding protein [Oscillospiraceae bacterium]
MKREDIAKIFEGATEEQINAVLDINSKDIGSAKKKLEIERDKYKNQLETAQNSLKEFEGVDVNELQSKIKTLTSDLETKDTECQQKIADMKFNSVLDGAISKSGAKNTKAVKALLDLDTLKTSKNQAEDITKALDEIKKDNDYMFTSDEPFQNPII